MRRRWYSGTVVVAIVAVSGLFGSVPAGAANWQISVNPNTGLSSGQSVLVTGTGFTETPIPQVVDWAITECSAAVLNQPLTLELAIANCDLTSTPFVFVTADSAGNVSGQFPVVTSFTPLSSAAAPIDCTKTGCVLLLAQTTFSGFVGAAAPISFGSSVPTCVPGHGHHDRHGHEEGRQHERGHHCHSVRA